MERDEAAPPRRERDGSPRGESLSGRTLGEFVVGELIGTGGAGHVYCAHQRALSREVVIKVMRPRVGAREDDEATQRFLEEARLASRLDHPYAAHIYAFGAEPDGLRWIAMELVRGTPLREILKTQGSIPLRRFVPLLERICEVVYTAHQQGIVHCDLKPSNVMVISRAGRLLPKLLDLGIARLIDPEAKRAADAARRADKPAEGTPGLLDVRELHELSELGEEDEATFTQRRYFTGSPPYMAPEQWTDPDSADARTDLYALGILTYEAIAGRRPFRAESATSMAMAHAKAPVPPLGAGFPPALDAVLARALAKRQDDRYSDALELARAVRAASALELELETEPPPQLPPAVRETALARAPQPLADAVATLEAAREPRRALAAAAGVVQVAIRHLGVVALAALTRVGLDHGDDDDQRAVADALDRLRGDPVDAPGWLAATRTLVRGFAERPDAHPVPELVLLLCGDGAGEASSEWLDALAASAVRVAAGGAAHAGGADAGRETAGSAPGDASGANGADAGGAAGDGADTGAAGALDALLPELARLLTALSFLCDYPVVVCRAGRTEQWMGARRSSRPVVSLRGGRALAPGDVALASRDRELVLPLSPLVQLLPPAPGSPEEIFFFDGYSRHGGRLISLPVGFVRHDGELPAWIRDNLVDAEAGRDDGDDAGGGQRAPYMGLSAFSPGDADNYFGREREVEAGVNRLRVESMLAVIGPSGAGKSSFVQAGIIPALPGGWRAITARPGPAPLAQLVARLTQELGPDPGPRHDGDADGDRDRDAGPDKAAGGDWCGGDLRALIERDSDALGRVLRAHAEASGQILVLVIDQFEELLTLCLDDDERRRYAEALVRAARSPDEPVRLVVTLRDDFLLRAQQQPALRERLGPAVQLLVTPPPDELTRILVEPARRAGYEFEDPELPAEMVASIAGEPGALALLSFTASKLWELRDRHFRRLQRRAYHTLGGVGGALAQHAEDTLSRMSDAAPGRRALVREVFRQLVTADGTRAILSRRELIQMLGGGGEAEAVLEGLIAARLLVASEGDGDDRVEVVHEALLSSWPRLVEWRREDAESARLRDQLRAAARQWAERGRPRGLLWRGDALLEYRAWRARYRGSQTEAEEAFATACLREEARGRQLRRALLGAAFAVLVAGLVVVLAFNRRAVHERDRARTFAAQAAEHAARSDEHAAESKRRLLDLYVEQGRQALMAGDSMRALVYLAEARGQGADGPALRFLIGRATAALEGRQLVLAGHDGIVWAARFSPDGARIATGGDDHKANVWDASSGALLSTLAGHSDRVWELEFSPRGDALVTAGWDNAATLWDVASGRPRWTARHDGKVSWAGFARGGGAVATASVDETMGLWDVATGAPIRTIAAGSGKLIGGAASSDGRYVATIGFDKIARVWDAATGDPITGLRALGGYPSSVEFSPDGSLVAIASWDRLVRIVPVRGGRELTLAGHAQTVNRASFSPDGARLVTASDDGTAKVWSVATGALEATLGGHTASLTFAAFSPDGTRIATASRDGTARTWDAASGAPLWTFVGHTDGIWDADFDATGARLVTAGFDGTARVWDARKSAHEIALPERERDVTDAAMSPDGAWIAAAQEGGAIEIWTRAGQRAAALDTGYEAPRVAWSPDGAQVVISGGPVAIVWTVGADEPGLRLGHDDDGKEGVEHAAFSPDGGRIVTTGRDNTARIWNASTGELLVTLQGHTEQVVFGAFDPTGERVVTASYDRTARIWNAATGDLLHTLSRHTQLLATARFSADGERVITAGDDSVAVVWTADGVLVKVLEGHTDHVTSAALSPDGQLAVTRSQDGTIKVWEVATGRLLWSVQADAPRSRSLEILADGRLVLAPVGRTAKSWSITYDDRTPDALAVFAACHASHVLAGGRLERSRPDYRACNAR